MSQRYLTVMERITGALFLSLLFVPAIAQAADSPRQIIPFDSDWRFHLGDVVDGGGRAVDESGWRTLDLPQDWSIEGPLEKPPLGNGNNGFFRHGIGWYRKTFQTPDSSKKTVIEFDGVYMNSDMWINGHFLGRRPFGFIGFRYDLTEFLHHDGSPNLLAVRVDDSAEPSTRWYSGSGIYRHVRLIQTNFTGFRLEGGVRITTPQVSPESATVEANYIMDANFFSNAEREAFVKDVWHAKPTTRPLVLRSEVLDADGAVLATLESTLNITDMHHGDTAMQRITIPKPRLWSCDTPELYRLRSTLETQGQALDEVTTTFGIRELRFEPQRGLFVNGKPTKLKGVCVHQDAGSFGNVVPIEVWALRLQRLREMGCNAIRPSHHPFAPEFYDLCDKMGFYVFDESFDEWTRDWAYNYTEDTRGKATFGYHLYFLQWHDTDLRALLHRDRNHPCVVLWSVGNEIPNQFDPDGYKIAKELVAICHEEDPTRLVSAACDQSYVSSRNGFMDQLDIMGYNYVDRLYGTKSYAPEHERFPSRLLMGTETGASIHMWLGVRDIPSVIGEFVWTGIDYLGEAGNLPRRGSGAGFMDLAAGRKPSYYQRAAYWSDKPVLKLMVSRSRPTTSDAGPTSNYAGPGGPGIRRREAPAKLAWSDAPGAALSVRAATNCDEVELFLNDKSLGRQKISGDLYYGDWPVTFAPGTLSAIGYRDGKPVAKDQLVTPGPAAKLKVTPLASPIGGDVTFFEITLTDAAGNPVIDAAPTVTVKVEGGGQLIGLDTSDLTYAGNFKTDTRAATDGRLLASVRTNSAGGEVQLTATATGLEAATAGSTAAK